MATHWRPFVDGEVRNTAECVLQVVTQALYEDLSSDSGLDGCLQSGSAGRAVALGYVACAQRDSNQLDAAMLYLKAAVDWLKQNDAGRPLTLFGGATGVAWAIQHLTRMLEMPFAQDPLEEFDERLLRELARPASGFAAELMSGVAGRAVYFLERWPHPNAEQGLRRILAILEEQATANGNQFWFESRGLWAPAGGDDGINLGIAHGVPGVIAALTSMVEVGIAAAEPLLVGAMDWLWSTRLVNKSSQFGTRICNAEEPPQSRLSWCYGDIGIAIVLIRAAAAIDSERWRERGLRTATEAAKRRAGAFGAPFDGGFCHGAAGVAHIWQRLANMTGSAEYAEAASYWIGEVLTHHRAGQGFGGFLRYKVRDVATNGTLVRSGEWIAEGGLLSGSSGIALVLLSGTTDTTPSWDRMFGLSGPPAIVK